MTLEQVRQELRNIFELNCLMNGFDVPADTTETDGDGWAMIAGTRPDGERVAIRAPFQAEAEA